MSLFTVIVGSAYYDGTQMNYLVEATDAKAACEYAVRIAVAHNDNLKTAILCFEGEVKFCPTIFDSPSFPDGPYIPPVVDLRQPPTPPAMSRWASAIFSSSTATKVAIALNNRSFLYKKTLCASGVTVSMLVPPNMGDDKAAEVLRNCYAVSFPHPITTDAERKVQSLSITFVETEATV